MFYQNSNFLINLIDRTNYILSASKKILPLYSELKPAIKNINKVRKFISNNNLNKFFKNIDFNYSLPKDRDNKKVEDENKSTSSTIKFFL